MAVIYQDWHALPACVLPTQLWSQRLLESSHLSVLRVSLFCGINAVEVQTLQRACPFGNGYMVGRARTVQPGGLGKDRHSTSAIGHPQRELSCSTGEVISQHTSPFLH